MVKAKKKRKLTKEESEAVGRKIHKIKKHEPGRSHKATVGKAIGMVLDKKRKRRCRKKSIRAKKS